jgi:hypothetical protein
MDIWAALLDIPLRIITPLLTKPLQDWLTNHKEQHRQRLKLSDAKSPPLQPVTSSCKEPAIHPVDISFFSFDALMEGIIVSFRNTEERFFTTAHNLTATLTYTPFHGESVRLRSAPWLFASEGQHKPDFITPVSIAMSEIKGLVVLLYQNPADPLVRKVDQAYMLPGDDVYNGKPHHILDYGEWTLLIHLDGDNFSGEYKYTLSLTPKGHPRIAPIRG